MQTFSQYLSDTHISLMYGLRLYKLMIGKIGPWIQFDYHYFKQAESS